MPSEESWACFLVSSVIVQRVFSPACWQKLIPVNRYYRQKDALQAAVLESPLDIQVHLEQS
jgi:hypothetical protein